MEPSGKIPGVIFAPEVNCYKCPLLHHYPECNIACVEYIEHMIENESDVAAVLIEPVVGTNGILVPPNEYMPRLREICDKHDVLLIADEVMSGWGRTGKWFAVDHWNVKPDILTTAKGITTAYMPLGLCATSKKIADFFEDHYFSHGHTYEAHPLTLAPAVASINEMKRLNLNQRATEMGVYLGKKLSELKSKHKCVGDVRGIGMFWAVDLVKNQQTKEPFNTYKDKINGTPLVVDKVAMEMMKNGVFVQAWVSHFVIAPPLIINKEEIELGVKALDDALKIADDCCT
jgi:taurine--2-oxoglutarate transaminase